MAEVSTKMNFTGRINKRGDQLCVVEVIFDGHTVNWLVAESLFAPNGEQAMIPHASFKQRGAAFDYAMTTHIDGYE